MRCILRGMVHRGRPRAWFAALLLLLPAAARADGPPAARCVEASFGVGPWSFASGSEAEGLGFEAAVHHPFGCGTLALGGRILAVAELDLFGFGGDRSPVGLSDLAPTAGARFSRERFRASAMAGPALTRVRARRNERARVTAGLAVDAGLAARITKSAWLGLDIAVNLNTARSATAALLTFRRVWRF